jgi:polyhydroxybutyrate depolymerase
MKLSPGTHELTIPGEGSLRRALLHLSAAESGPLVMMLHGAGADMRWTLDETAWDRTAERERFQLLIPEALPLDPSRPFNFLKNPTWWNDGSPASTTAPREVDDVAFLSHLLDEWAKGQVFVTGFSNGAGMTFRLAAAMSKRLTAIAPVAGYCWHEAEPLPRPLPTLYLLGKEDPLVPVEGGTVRSPWGWVEERPPIAETLERWRRAVGEERFKVRLIDGLGHHWPGGRGLLSRRLFGPPLPALVANDVIWDFFTRLRNEPEA